ncbi:putative selenate ABC transporter substrate-binding protein [Synechococcus sp. RSCCF101]|uniref:putative selenate ABC transporter substrate-binding protein n=1 Tax=Synechococcus sp. RSCCF101 TaxID=2511069 RepID=UPI00351AAC7A
MLWPASLLPWNPAALAAAAPAAQRSAAEQQGALHGAVAQGQLLRIGAIPDQNPEKLNRLYKLLADHLSRSLGGVPVRYVPVSDYTAAVSAFRTGQLDLVWFGGLTGVQARLQRPGARVLAQRDIDKDFRSVFIANSGSGLTPLSSQKDLTRLKGKRFTFGSESSTSGRLMPQHFLAQAGVTLKDFAGGAPGFSGSHDATLALVQSGAYQAGVLNEQVWLSNVRAGKVDADKVSVIWRTPGYPDYHWVAQPGLDKRFGDGFTVNLKEAILELDGSSSGERRILELFGAERFIPARAAEYRPIETVGREIGKIR